MHNICGDRVCTLLRTCSPRAFFCLCRHLLCAKLTQVTTLSMRVMLARHLLYSKPLSISRNLHKGSQRRAMVTGEHNIS